MLARLPPSPYGPDHAHQASATSLAAGERGEHQDEERPCDRHGDGSQQRGQRSQIVQKAVHVDERDAPDRAERKLAIDRDFVRARLADLVRDEDLSRYIL